MRKATVACGLLGGLGLVVIGALAMAANPAWLHHGWMWSFLDGSHAGGVVAVLAMVGGVLAVAGATLVLHRPVPASLVFGGVDAVGLLIVYVSPNIGRSMGFFAAPGALVSIACFLAAMDVARVIPALPLDGGELSEAHSAS